MSGGVTLDVDGVELTISSPDKVYFPERGETKLDLVRYYQAVAGPLLDRLGGRPVLLERYPDGAGGKSWFQKRVPKTAPSWLTTTVVSTPNGTTSDALVAADLAHVLWAVNQGCLGFHVWPNRAAALEIADELRIDLDPSPGIGFPQLREAAWLVRAFLEEVGIEVHVKTSGSRGLHLYAILEPRWDGYQVRAAAVALARELARRHPELITAQWWKEERGSRVFVDFNQNAPHKTVFGAWCVRPRVGGQVSTPIAWEELDSVEPDALTLSTVPGLVAERGDPWGGVNGRPQSIEVLLEMSRRDLAEGLMDAPWPPVYPKMPGEPPRVAPSRARKG
ncbi:non-homologous end-joining DNA ligase [Amycolatopsis sp. NPDC051903]|uniref:non-homologous end-joining DNA ligase n=1 Tax=Amycolatopsis sp. NPDC051903 TaxID=3363936 RepID=UPI0037B398C5